MDEFIEKVIVERNKVVDDIILGEIQKIATENGVVTKITLNEKAIVSALEKQIPKKPVIKYHQEGKTPVKYGRLMELHCPNCNKLIVAMYERDREMGGGLHTDVKGCHKCLQAVDFAEYYYIGNLGEEIELE